MSYSFKKFYKIAPNVETVERVQSSVTQADIFITGVANAKFSLLKLLIYEPYYLP
jgi:hypothetical protein